MSIVVASRFLMNCSNKYKRFSSNLLSSKRNKNDLEISPY
jgi:hypothetical protein